MSISTMIYFAKPEELILTSGLDKELGYQVIGEILFQNRRVVHCISSGVTFSMMSGESQGEGFIFDYMNMLFVLKPKRVILCGICAGGFADRMNTGDVIIAEKSKLLSGKLSKNDFTQLELDGTESRSTVEHDVTVHVVKEINDLVYDNEEEKKEKTFRVHSGSLIQSPFVLNIDLRYLFDKLSDGERKVLGVDMESWYFFNMTSKFGMNPLPVIKGVSDYGSGKTDLKHSLAIRNALLTSLKFVIKASAKDGLKREDTSTFSLSSGPTQPEVVSAEADEPQEESSSEDEQPEKRVKVSGHKRAPPRKSKLSWVEVEDLEIPDDDKKKVLEVMKGVLTINQLKKIKNIRSISYKVIEKRLIESMN